MEITLMRYAAFLVTVFVAAALAGCGNWVEVKPQARDVAVLDPAQATNCQYLGKTSTSVLNHAGFFPRNPQAINADLVNLARNNAVKLDGNAVAPLGPRDHGHQVFGIYRCGDVATNRAPQTAGSPQQAGIKTIPYTPPR
ncbi:MAG TPA: DUF4156 domain-containing protein [Gammaproteobacteria bacterium]|nr:DUF4156 domain-containing protein [Gammaproteobacteria bacterium]